MISLVIPAFNEEDGLSELYQRIVEASCRWDDLFEIILVDDGSSDRTLEIATSLARTDPRFKVVSLSRNFGHQSAVSAGLAHASGEIVSVMDADLQDPPEELHHFISKLREGFDVVYAIRTKRKENIFKRSCYFLYYRLLNRMATLDIPLDAGDFCVMRSEVVEAINQLPERNRFVRGLRTWVGFRQTGLSYERAARFGGEPKYTLSKLIRLAADGIINFSYRPLQLIMLIGFGIGLGSILLACFVLLQYIFDWTIFGFNPHHAKGWTSLIFVILFLNSAQFFCLGILGEYIGRSFEESKNRPIYLVKRRLNLEAKPLVQ